MKFVPHAYQRYCINRIITTPALGLLLDMGLGKTVITLTAINDLKYNRFAVSKVLVIAPKKVAESTWAREARKWDHLHLLRISTVLGSAAKRIRALNTPADVYVINRENVPWLVDYYRNAWPFDMVVIDEFSSFKNHQAKRFKALAAIRPHIKRIVGLTGTPAPNGLMDLWAQIYLLDGGERLGKRITGFRERYFEPDRRDRERVFTYAPKHGAEEAIQRRISDICISMKAEDYLELPDVISNTVPVHLDAKAQKAYSKLEAEMLLEVDESTIDAGSAAVLTNKLLQLCNGAVYDGDRNIVEIHNSKIEAFMELIEGLNGKPALVFYSFQHDRDRLLKALIKTGLRVRELKTPQDETDWNNHKIDILLAHPASTAYGLNLQEGGNHVIWFGLTWSRELYEQANKRLHRQGQTEKVIIHHLVVEGSVDEDVMAALERKGETQSALMEALKVRIERVKEVASR
ncbi:DEAD/DEAH box helicase [Caldibacillus debilis]|uniref:Superfamily II DNA/RNA helicase, SNF2 family n=1 Tax=Caldibacillus debilis GB1 TaxID=1339248 RepID=A0A420VHV9_9BACI|nr:DEAD/DEAH box helicase [Caldibacillus debilis]RKO63244.1 Superfamily II DNA/RNA helicase, SNF2 family [Caldibacillus debilis GB1]